MQARPRRYEVRDPIHGFVAFDSLEKEILDTAPVQRLRHIKQLALTNQLYPGATHTRLEHALGVMELAGRAFDTIHENAGGAFREWMGWDRPDEAQRQRRALRLAALLHDVGHAPFSHAAEELLPPEVPREAGHEWFTEALIADPDGEIAGVLRDSHHNALGITPREIVALAVEYEPEWPLRFQEVLLASLISGPLGVDRMDYLVRDSHHTGVTYGLFDHLRLLNTLRVTQPGVDPYAGQIGSPGESQGGPDADQGAGQVPELAIATGGLHSAEGLLLARHFMFLQVYRHHVRQIYDVHLREFLRAWLPGGVFPADPRAYLRLDDAVVETAIREYARSDRPEDRELHTLASRLTGRRHYRLAARISAQQRADSDLGLEFLDVLREELAARFGEDAVRAEVARLGTSRLLHVPIVDDSGAEVPEEELPRLFESVGEFWEARVFCAPGNAALREGVERWVNRWLARHSFGSRTIVQPSFRLGVGLDTPAEAQPPGQGGPPGGADQAETDQNEGDGV